MLVRLHPKNKVSEPVPVLLYIKSQATNKYWVLVPREGVNASLVKTDTILYQADGFPANQKGHDNTQWYHVVENIHDTTDYQTCTLIGESEGKMTNQDALFILKPMEA